MLRKNINVLREIKRMKEKKEVSEGKGRKTKEERKRDIGKEKIRKN